MSSFPCFNSIGNRKSLDIYDRHRRAWLLLGALIGNNDAFIIGSRGNLDWADADLYLANYSQLFGIDFHKSIFPIKRCINELAIRRKGNLNRLLSNRNVGNLGVAGCINDAQGVTLNIGDEDTFSIRARS